MAIGGLSLDLGGGATTGTGYAQSATGYAQTIGSLNFILLIPRLQDYTTTGNNARAFSAYFDSNDYLSLYSNNTTGGSALQMRAEWNANGTNAIVDFKTTSPNELYTYGVRHKSVAVWRDGTAFKVGLLDFGGDSNTRDPSFVVKTSGTALVAGHNWDVLDAGFIQLCRFNATQQGTMAYGPIVIVKFTGAVTWTNADIEQALMDPSSIPDIVTLRGGCSIAHQWDAVSRGGVVQSPEWRMDLQGSDVLEDTVGGVDMTITLGTGTPKLYRSFVPAGRWDSATGKWQNVLENFYPIAKVDPSGGYWYTRQATNPSSYQQSYLCHCDADGLDDRHPIILPGKMAYFTPEGDGPWADRVEITGDLIPGLSSLLSEYHHGTAIDVAGGMIRLLHRRHSITAVSSGSPTAPVVANSRYIHGAEYAHFAQTSRGDVDAVTPGLTDNGFTLAASGNGSLEYESVSGSYAAIGNDGTYFYEITRAGGGPNGYLVATRTNIATGTQDILKLTTSDLSGTGTPPLAVVPITSDFIGLVFSVRDPTSSYMTGARMIVADVTGSWDEGEDFHNINGTELVLPLSQDELRTGPDGTGTDITGYGDVAADVGYARCIGNGNGVVITAAFHQVDNAGVYDGAKMQFLVVVKSGWVSHSGFSASHTLDITDLVEAEVAGWRSASGKNQWSSPQVVWLNTERTQALVCFTDPDGATMTANGASLGGCPDTPRFGTRVLGIVITNLTTTPVATWYGEIYAASGDVLSIDIPSFAGSAYMPFLMLQAYVGPTGASNDLLGQVIYLPVDLEDVEAFADGLPGAGTSNCGASRRADLIYEDNDVT